MFGRRDFVKVGLGVGAGSLLPGVAFGAYPLLRVGEISVVPQREGFRVKCPEQPEAAERMWELTSQMACGELDAFTVVSEEDFDFAEGSCSLLILDFPCRNEEGLLHMAVSSLRDVALERLSRSRFVVRASANTAIRRVSTLLLGYRS